MPKFILIFDVNIHRKASGSFSVGEILKTQLKQYSKYELLIWHHAIWDTSIMYNFNSFYLLFEQSQVGS